MLKVALYGSVGDSRWRDYFTSVLAKYDVEVYNPVKLTDGEIDLQEEIEALRTSDIIVSVITSETYSNSSLVELGFLVNEVTSNKNKVGHFYIAQDLATNLADEDKRQYENSLHHRRLVLNHLRDVRGKNSNIHIHRNSTQALCALGVTLKEKEEVSCW